LSGRRRVAGVIDNVRRAEASGGALLARGIAGNRDVRPDAAGRFVDVGSDGRSRRLAERIRSSERASDSVAFPIRDGASLPIANRAG
jgi:hypothetical protein